MEGLQQIREWLALEAKKSTRRDATNLTVLFNGFLPATKAAAQQLAKEYKKEIHEVGISQVVTKYIGETEKNLAAFFEKAQSANAILVFDEADALFGKRTTIRDAHDKYANQEVSYLLKQLEKFNGLIIFVTTNKKEIDEALIRRMRIIVDFPKPQKS